MISQDEFDNIRFDVDALCLQVNKLEKDTTEITKALHELMNIVKLLLPRLQLKGK